MSQELKALNRFQKWANKPKKIEGNWVMLDKEGQQALKDFALIHNALIELEEIREELEVYKKAFDKACEVLSVQEVVKIPSAEMLRVNKNLSCKECWKLYLLKESEK